MPIVSIVVPTYNVENYLRECLDSLVNQTLQDIEIICVDDGSTDSSPEILRSYADQDKRIKIITKANSGYGNTMNVGIKAATGEYLGIVEPDDYVKTNMYKELSELADDTGADILKADFYRFVNENDTVVRTYNQLTKIAGYYNRMIDPTEEQTVFKFIMNTWSGIYRMSFLKEHSICHNETPGASFQDNGFWFQGFCLSHKVYFSDKSYYMNRRDNPNSSVKNRSKVFCANVEYDFIKKFLTDHGLYETFKNVFVMKLWHNCWFTYNRIANEFKLQYLKKVSEDFAPYVQENLIVQPWFSNNEIFAIKKLVSNYRLFYYEYRAYNAVKRRLK